MENASNALIMAGGVLIGILVLSLAVYLFADFGATSAQINAQNAQSQLTQFNSQFTSYEGKDGLTIYDVVTVASYASENNKYYSDSLSEHKIVVYLYNPTRREIQDNIDGIKISLIENDKNLISGANLSLPTYNCKVLSYYGNGRVHEISFTRK